MKIGYLLGACGLAVTGAATTNTAYAAEPGTPEFRQMVDESRALIREGRREMRNLTHLNAIDDRISFNGTTAVASSGSRAIPHAWAGMIDGDDFVLDFDNPTYDAAKTTFDPTPGNPFISIGTVVDPNGNGWTVGSGGAYTGVADNALAQSGPRFDPDGNDGNPATEGWLEGDKDQHGEVGGPDPGLVNGNFLWSAAGTSATQPYSTGSRTQGWLQSTFYAPTTSTPVVTMVDMYHDRVDSGMWWAPLSQTEGNFFVLSSYWFGYTYSVFADLADPDNVLRRPFVLGPRPGDPNTGNFFVPPASSPWRIKTDEWFTVGIRQAIDSYSIWIQDSDTVGVNGFEQNSIYDGISGGADPGNTQGAFAGEIFETDWLQIIPGVADDGGTAVVEGYGSANNQFGQFYTVQTDGSGSPAGPTFNSVGIDTFHYRGGFDPPLSQAPDWTPNDHGMDNYVIMGDPFPLPDPKPDRTVPFVEDIELWTPGALSIQGQDWFVTLLQNPAIVDYENNTPGGTQAIEQIAVFRDNVAQLCFRRRNMPSVTATAVPAVAQASVNMSDTFLSRGFTGVDTNDTGAAFSQIIYGGRDAGFLVDDFIYVRQANNAASGSTNPFDPAQPATDQSGRNVVDNGTDNVGQVNIRLTDGGGVPFTIPAGAWFDTRCEVTFDISGNHPMDVFFDFGGGLVAAQPDPSAAAFNNPRQILSMTSPTPTVSQFDFETGGEVSGLLSTVYVDDMLMDGPRSPQAYVQEVEGGDYGSDPVTLSGWMLPYDDDMSSYLTGQAADDKGYTPFLQNIFTDVAGELDIIDLPGGFVPVAGTTPVFTYVIDSIVLGGDINGQTAGATVAVVDNIPDFYDTTNAAVIPGVNGGSTRVNQRNALRIRIAAADWTLQAPASAPWDGVTTIVGRYEFQYDYRIQAVNGQNLVVDDPTASGRGNVISLSSNNSNDATTGDTDFVFQSQMPEARALGGSEAILSFDMWVGDGVNAVNSGRTVWNIQGPGAQRGSIAQIAFGGPNNFEDLVSFDNLTGVISPGPDGEPDNFQFNDFQSTPNNMYVLGDNPFVGASQDFLWADTGDAAPANTWVTCTARIDNAGNWEATIDDGVSPLVYSGTSLTLVTGSGADVSGTDHLQIDFGNDPGSNGGIELPALEWYSLGQSAAPEGGLDVLTSPAGPGVFNDTLKYFYYETVNILAPSLNMPLITDVNVGDGSVIGAREVTDDDHIVFWNNAATAGMGGAPALLNSARTPRNTEFHFLNSAALDGDPANPSDVLARGTFVALGTPGANGVTNPIGPGGISVGAPPYGNGTPYEDMLMGTLVGYSVPATTSAPRHTTLIDNIHLELDTSCLTDISGDGVTDGADLGILLGAWGFGGAADLNGDGVVDGADLGILLGNWGVSC
jgi:hypothetical protein